MKNFFIFIVFLALLFAAGYYYLKNYFFITVGGPGKIEVYDYNVMDTVLQWKLDSIVSQDYNYNWIDSDVYFEPIVRNMGYNKTDALFADLLARYKEDRYIKVNINEARYLFEIGIIKFNNDLNSSIVLISACLFGDDPPPAKDMGRRVKKKYQKLFEEAIVSKVVI